MPVIGWLIALAVWSIASLLALILSFIFTSPLGLGPIGVTLWFVVAFLSMAGLFSLLFYGAKSYLRLHATRAARLRYSRRQGLLVGGWVIGLLALSSLNQLGALDAILLGILLVIVEVYVRLRWP